MEDHDESVHITKPISGGSMEPTNYALDHGEWEVPVEGRTGVNRSKASAWLQNGGAVRIDDDANPELWIKFQIPEEYIREQYHYLKQQEREKKKRIEHYQELKKEFVE